MGSNKDFLLVEGWVEEHGDYLHCFATTRLNGDREMARDMVQETFIAGWKAYQAFEGKSTVRTWLTGILKYKIIDHIRKQVRVENLADEISRDPSSDWFGSDGRWHESPKAWGSSPESLCENDNFHMILHRCMAKLPDVQRQVFTQRELSGDSSDAICKDLDISSSNLHVLMHRARLSLRACLNHHWFGKREL
ncbi:MAG: sigma-70 family RNA polymerase sigma factor [Mariprofundus sp.]|nr:sigma-70 family RNA polymerase sigma factor [Mariprofundus sp.]